ncbi:protein FAM114A2 isoform X2 [Cynoglossus semilaevis]|uniref:protein FAM114A2 isoform X2 n=1 Tax=Cynoglossus semilaevis TaxID=244447 RepID=UPI000D62E4F0|nr:protein FAM114A2 isoform X2 [Cynoglossus semilaevis]
MSDSRVSQRPEEDAVPADAASSPDVSTDVAPTRKARRRPEVQTMAPEKEEGSKREEEGSKSQTTVSTEAQSGWGYWGSWGKSLLSTATATVATVGQGLGQVMERAESTLGIPSPTELSAQMEEEEKQRGEKTSVSKRSEVMQEFDCVCVCVSGGSTTRDVTSDTDSSLGGAMGMLSSLSSVVQSTGKTVISGGLDALEFIGKKTMDVIAEGDPGFRKTKGLMNRNATLSQVLREAKEREELQTEETESADSDRKLVAHYGVLFDEFQGLSHLEALEILSRESESKVKSVLTTLSGDQLQQLKRELQTIKEPFSLVEFDEEEVDEDKGGDGAGCEEELTRVLDGLGVPAAADHLITACKDASAQISHMTSEHVDRGEEEVQEEEVQSVEEIHAAAIRTLAELTARSIQLFHKLAEKILSSSCEADAAVLSRLTLVLCKQVSLLSKKFTSCLTSAGTNDRGDVLNPMITNVFLEASNSASYIQDAFVLLLPVLEVSHIQRRSSEQQGTEPIQSEEPLNRETDVGLK